MNIKFLAIIPIMLISSQVSGATYTADQGTYLAFNPSTNYACGRVNGFTVNLNSQYFTTTNQPISYFTSYDFFGYEVLGGPYNGSSGAFASTISANNYTGLENANTFRFGSSQTLFTLGYASNIFFEPVVKTYSCLLDVRSQKDRVRMTFTNNVIKSPISITSAATANSAINSTSCLTINMTNPCLTVIPATQFLVTLPSIIDYSNPSNNKVPFSAFSTSTCNVMLNNTASSSATCTLNGETLTISGLVTSSVSTQSLSLKICDVLRTNAAPNSMNLKFVNSNSNYTSPANIYAEGNFSY